MIVLELYKNKHIGVLGLGKTGNSVIASLEKAGGIVYKFDDSLSYEYTTEDIAKLDALVVSPGISTFWPIRHKLVDLAYKNAVPVLNDVDLFLQHSKTTNICITGTNGKSTTTALIGHVFSNVVDTCIGGNIGNPLLSLNDSSRYCVLELSSYQLEMCNILGFDTAILLNITPDHLSRHGGMDGYTSAKQRIFANFKKTSIAIISLDDVHCVKIYEFLKKIGHPNVIPISGNRVPEGGIGWCKDELIDNRFGNYDFVCKKNELLSGEHNYQNIAASYAACVANRLNKDVFCAGLASFRGLAHRQELVLSIDGVVYVNDSKATNAESVEHALKRFDDIIWIVGGRPKEVGIEILSEYFGKIKMALLIGEVAEEWSILLSKAGVKNAVVKTLDVAVRTSFEKSSELSAKTVLLSPACASFDQFKSFEERGDLFRSLVKAL